jgi:hypothetical protein
MHIPVRSGFGRQNGPRLPLTLEGENAPGPTSACSN